MIDKKKTLEIFGVDIDTLTHGSDKSVWAICRKCGKGRELPFNYATKDKLCHSCAMKGKYTGKNSYNWKGGCTPWRESLYSSNAYKNWRTAVFKRDNYTCMMCDNKRSGYIQAHHIKPVREHKNDLLIFDINNGIHYARNAIC